jgi:hypothetical protein
VRRALGLGALALGALAFVACDGGGGAVSPSGSPSVTPEVTTSTPPPTGSASPTPTGSPSASLTPEPVLQLPPDAPTSFGGTLSADGPFDPLVPPGAEILDAWFREPSGELLATAGVVWGRGADPFARELGVVLWERLPDPSGWRATYAFTDGPARGVLGISVDVADVTSDGIDDALTFESTGGSGACGRWRVLAPRSGGADVALRRSTCDAQISIVGGDLELREAVFEPDDAHCCPSAFRTTTLEWDGSAFVATDVREEPAPSP